MDIALLSTINSNYRIPFEILVTSLVKHKQHSTTIEWHVFTDEPQASWHEWIDFMNVKHLGMSTRFILHRLILTIHAKLSRRGRSRPIMYARLMAPEQLEPSTSRLIYLDADMIALGPIEELWDVELGPHTCACAQDIAIPTVSSNMAIHNAHELGIHPNSPYFNAGVMLIDTRKWSERKITFKAFEYLTSHHESVNMFDQEALNAAVGENWVQVSYRWNLIASVSGRPFLDARMLNQPDYEASLRHPCLIHYAGTLKPWLNPYLEGRWYMLYREALTDAFPAYKYNPKHSLKYRLQAAYDRHLRGVAYPLERFVWTRLRGF